MRLCEAMELPGRVDRLLQRPSKIRLKDGRIGILTVRPMDKDNQLVPLDHAINLSAVVEVDGVLAGSMDIAPNQYAKPEDDYDLDADVRGTWSVNNVHVNANFRRQGIATAMYDIFARAGMRILASGGGRGGKLMPDGASLWDTRRIMKRGRLVYPYPLIWKPTKRS